MTDEKQCSKCGEVKALEFGKVVKLGKQLIKDSGVE
jgi:hypothetical protein